MGKHCLNTHGAVERGAKPVSSALSWGRSPPPCHATSQPGTMTPQRNMSHLVGITPARGHLHLLSQPPKQLCLPLFCGSPEPLPRHESHQRGHLSWTLGSLHFGELESSQGDPAELRCSSLQARAEQGPCCLLLPGRRCCVLGRILQHWLGLGPRVLTGAPCVCLFLHSCKGLVYVSVTVSM